MLKKIALVLFSAVLLVSCSRGIAVAEEDNALPEMTGDIYRLGTPENMKEAFSYVFGYMLAASASEKPAAKAVPVRGASAQR